MERDSGFLINPTCDLGMRSRGDKMLRRAEPITGRSLAGWSRQEASHNGSHARQSAKRGQDAALSRPERLVGPRPAVAVSLAAFAPAGIRLVDG
jgi:hypothetical protein